MEKYFNLFACLFIGSLIFPSASVAAGYKIIAENWGSCIRSNGDIPDWAKVQYLRQYYDDDPRYLAQWGLCNEKYHRLVICAGNYFEFSPDSSDSSRVCWAVFKGNPPTGLMGK